MPNRIVRDGILTSERVARLDWAAEVFYRRLLSVVDDFGRYYAAPKLLRAACYPLQIDSVKDADIEKWVTACVAAQLVTRYGDAEGKQYMQVHDFRQQVRAKVSRFPSPDDHLHSTCVADAKQPLADAHLDVDVDVDVDVFGDGDEGDNPRKRASADADLFPDVPEQVVRDFKAIRRTKKAAITPTAMAGIVREAEKAGMTLAAALAVCCERGWAGFKAEWVTRDAGSGQPTPAGTPRKRRMLS